MSDFYIEVFERLPFSTLVELYKQHVPRFLANGLVGWLKFRTALGFPQMPQYGFRWSPDFDWQSLDEMPAQALSRWAPLLERLEDLGFTLCGCAESEVIGSKQEATSLLMNESGIIMASLLWLKISTIEQTRLSFTSYRDDGTEIMTAELPETEQLISVSLTPEYVNLTYEPDTISPEKLYRVHCDRPQINEAISFSRETLLEHYRKQRIKLFDHTRKKEFVRSLTSREVAYLTSRSR